MSRSDEPLGSAPRLPARCAALVLGLLLAAAPVGAAVPAGDYCVVGLGANRDGTADGWLALVTPAGAVTDLTPSLSTALVNPWDCAVDPTTGDVLVVDEGNTGNANDGAIHRVSVVGATVTQTVLHSGAPLVNPRGISVDSGGTIYVSDLGRRTNGSADGAIYALPPGGALVRLDTGGVGLVNPIDLDVDPRPYPGASAGVNLLILEMRGGDLLRVPTAGGDVQLVFTGPGGNEWRSLEVGPYGNAFLADRDGRSVERHDRLTGARTTIATNGGGSALDRPQGLTIDYRTADVVVADENAGVVNVPPNAYLGGAPLPTAVAGVGALPGSDPAGIGFSPPLASAAPSANFGVPTRRAPIAGAAFALMGPGNSTANGEVEHELNLFIEVTDATAPLAIHIFDANLRDGYDAPSGSFDTAVTYELYDPAGALVTTTTIAANARVDLDQRIATLNGDGTLTVRGPGVDLAGLGLGPGLYRLRAVLPANNDFNVFGVWVEGFQTYTFSSSFGSLNTFTGPAPDLTPLDPARMYPVFERGCEYTASNFDLDVNSRPASLALTTALGELFPLTGTNNNVHAEDTIDPAPGAAAPASREIDYGIHTLESVLSPNSVENNLVTLRFADFQGWVDAGGAGVPVPVPPGNPAANPTASLRTSPGPAYPQTPFGPATNTFLRHYLPRYDESPAAAAAPYAPYMIHAATPLTGDPPVVGVPARYAIQITVVNPDPVNPLANVVLNAAVPAPTSYVESGPQVSGPATATGGGLVTTCGAAPCSGVLTATWPSIAPGSAETLSYAVEVTATAPGERMFLTGGPTVRGGGAAPAANAAPGPGTTATFVPAWSSTGFPRTASLGPLCDLSVVEGTVTPVAVSLARLEAIPGDGEVVLEWETAAEFDNLGFHVLRRLAGEPDFTRITSELILGRGTTDLTGRYALRDATAPNGVRAEYLLEDVALDGRRTLHGPVQATPRQGLDGWTAGPEGLSGQATISPATSSQDVLARAALPGEDGGTSPGVAPPSPGPTAWIERSMPGSDGVLLELGVAPLAVSEHEIEGVPFTRVEAPGTERTLAPGRPDLPLQTLWIEVDDHPVVRVEVVEREGTSVALQTPVEPVAGAALDGSTATLSAELYPAGDPGVAPYPATPVALGGSIASGDGRRLLALHVQPARVVGDTLQLDRRLLVRVILEGPPARAAEPGAADRSAAIRAVAALPGVKIAVHGPGITHVPATAFLEAGIDPGSDPRNLHVYRLGREVAVVLLGEEDGRLDPDDDLLLWSDGVDDRYTEEDVVFVVAGSTPGLRVPSEPAPASVGSPVREIGARTRFEEQRIYLPGILNGEGDNFVGRFVFDRAVEVSVPSPAALAEPARLRVRLRGGTTYAAIDPDHDFEIRVAGTPVADARFDGSEPFETVAQVTPALLGDPATTVEIVPRFGSGAPFDLVYVDALELDYRRRLDLTPADAGRLVFVAERDGTHAIGGLAAASELRLWDVSDPDRPVAIDTLVDTAGQILFEARRGARYALVTSEGFASAVQVSANAPSRWIDSGLSADWLVIAEGELMEPMRRLAAYRERRGMRTAVIDVEDVYDEVAGGRFSPPALRTFVRSIASGAPEPLRYLVLAGDATYDYRDHLRGRARQGVPTMLVDTRFVEAASDSYFGDLDGDGAPELAVGRISARSAGEAEAIVDKIVAAEADDPARTGEAHARLLLVADDGLGAGDPREAERFEAVLDAAAASASPDFPTARVALGALPDASEGQLAASAIATALEAGVGLAVYAGHGGARVWADELIFSADDLVALEPAGPLPLFVVLNCLNAFFDAPNEESFAEAALRAPTAGATAFISSTTVSAFAAQDAFARALSERILRDGVRRAGDALRDAQQRLAGVDGAGDVLASFVLIGDPATRLSIPLVPRADAGADRRTDSMTAADLDGTASRSPSGAPLSYRWRIIAQPAPDAGILLEPDSARARLVVTVPGDYRVALEVDDGRWRSAPDLVVIQADSAPARPLGCAPGESAGPTSWSGGDLLYLLLPWGAARMRRRRR